MFLVKHRLFTSLVAGLVLVWLASLWFFAGRYDVDQQAYFQQQTHDVEMAWQATLNAQHKAKQAYFDSYVMQPRVLSHLIDAQTPSRQSMARDDLQALFEAAYQKMRSQGIYQFQFHLSDNTSFLRLHDPARFGDDLTDIRTSVRLVNQTQKPITGFDFGRVVAGLRSVFPIIYNGQHLGSVEFSNQFETLRRDLTQLSNQREYAIIFHPRASQMPFDDYKSHYQTSLIHPDWLVEDPTRELFQNASLPNLYLKQMATSLDQKDLTEPLLSGQAFVKPYQLNDQSHMSVFLPVNDLENKLMAYVVALSPAPELAKFERMFWIRGLVTGLFLLMIGLVVWRIMRHQEDLRIAAAAFNVQEGILITDPKGHIVRVNQAFTHLTGYELADVIGKTPAVLSSGRQDKDFYAAMWQALLNHGHWLGEIWNRRKNGEEYFERLSIHAIYDRKGRVSHYVGAFFDITKNKMDQDEIRQLAFYDPLTQLANRRLLLDRIEHALAASHQLERYGALLYMDLDRFKALNDTKGHDVGDKLLIEVAQRLTQSVREVDTVARLGGDEFVVLFEGLNADKQKAAYEAEMLAEKIRLKLGEPYNLDGFEYQITPSIGIALFLDHQDGGSDETLRHADSAMYQAKSSGRNMIRLFDPTMQADLEKRLSLEEDLKTAIELDQFEVFYQPQINHHCRVIGAEALIRWHHPTKGQMSPADFIPIAEENGLILSLGDWVLKQSVSVLAKWREIPAFSKLTLSVNISAQQLQQIDFVEQIRAYIEHYQFDPTKLKLELTESMMLMDMQDSIDKMQRLKKLGVKFSMDDFGTGYSSLLSIKNLPLDQLKIDQNFVRDLFTDTNAEPLVRSILMMSKELGLSVVAEGVETREHHQSLMALGCREFQGYLYSKPVSYADLLTFLVKMDNNNQAC
ncbi:bifunctional diguanylate cyclase/phosphodiesterase [Thiomicrospira sp.]|uniref:bifunctional diguanylate cyclase/phosphodiesterase n=1 Tax=Thiomicrospira sp. TaxID=935 RepID=UPI002F93BB21